MTFSTLAVCSSGTSGADFSFTEKQMTVYFKDNSTDAVHIVEWYWDFGDGTHSSDQDPIHTYPGYGKYVVYYRIVTSSGEVSQKSKTLTIARQEVSAPSSMAFYIPIFVIIIGIAGAIFSTTDSGRIISSFVVILGIAVMVLGKVFS
jgi:PKD repeat protein